MYVPAAFAETDTGRLHEFMIQQSFAVLTSHGDDGLVASHLPLLLDAGAGPHGHLLGHMARANPQWRCVRGEVLAVFSGPHAYVSPSWYDEAGTVPTWNYVAVHASGTFRLVEDRDGLLEILRRSVLAYEGSRPVPWAFEESGPHVERLLGVIVGFRIEITRLEGKWKLSQNHPERRRRRVIRALAAGGDDDSQAIAGMMEETLPSYGTPSATGPTGAGLPGDRPTRALQEGPGLSGRIGINAPHRAAACLGLFDTRQNGPTGSGPCRDSASIEAGRCYQRTVNPSYSDRLARGSLAPRLG